MVIKFGAVGIPKSAWKKMKDYRTLTGVPIASQIVRAWESTYGKPVEP